MDMRDRPVLIPAGTLDDVLSMASMAADRLPQNDALTMALRGAVAEARCGLVVAPQPEYDPSHAM